jgi:hypothetical protein
VQAVSPRGQEARCRTVVLEAEYSIIGNADDHQVPVRDALALGVPPPIDAIVQRHVGQQRAYHGPWRPSNRRRRPLAFLRHPGPPPYLDEAEEARIGHARLEELAEPFGGQGVAPAPHVILQHLERFPSRYKESTESFPWQAGASHAQLPYIQVKTALVHALPREHHRARIQGMRRTASRPEAGGEAPKVFLIARAEDRAPGLLDTLVLQRRDPPGALPPIGRRHVDSPGRLRPLGPAVDSAVEVSASLGHASLIRLPGHALDPRSDTPLQLIEAGPQSIDGELVASCRERLLPSFACHLTHAS